MSEFILKTKGFKEFNRALARNPLIVAKEVKRFLVRGIAEYNRSIIRSPWRVGGSGGGAPVKTGNLRDRHKRKVEKYQARIFVNHSRVKYARYVHDGTIHMKARPWLDYARESKEQKINTLADKMLKNIVKNLAK